MNMKQCVFTSIIIYFFLLGTCLEVQGAKKTKVIIDPEVVLEEGRKAFLDYDFDTAAAKYEEYRELQEKAKKPLAEELEEFEKQLSIASNAFDRVEKIVVIDSLSVPRRDFYKYYNLLSSSGYLKDGGRDEGNLEIPKFEYYFSNESDDYILWAEPDENNRRTLKEGNKLVGGDWAIEYLDISEPGDTTDYIYPFMLNDGQTLYFSNNGSDSMGGFDIFVAQRDAITGEFRQPLNLGMPFNSPYDDLLMAIDEESGLGWWATDRNSPNGNITIYVYQLNDVRRNYPGNTENLVAFARIDDYKLTQVISDGNELMILPSIPKKIEAGNKIKVDFYLPLGNGKEYNSIKDFKNRKAAEQMTLYLKKENELQNEEFKLNELRKRYHSQEKGVIPQIQQLEKKVENLRGETKNLLSEVYRLEKSTK